MLLLILLFKPQCVRSCELQTSLQKTFNTAIEKWPEAYPKFVGALWRKFGRPIVEVVECTVSIDKIDAPISAFGYTLIELPLSLSSNG